jgi:hypothetical protein
MEEDETRVDGVRRATRKRAGTSISDIDSSLEDRRRRPMTRWTPTDAFSNTVS